MRWASSLGEPVGELVLASKLFARCAQLSVYFFGAMLCIRAKKRSSSSQTCNSLHTSDRGLRALFGDSADILQQGVDQYNKSIVRKVVDLKDWLRRRMNISLVLP